MRKNGRLCFTGIRATLGLALLATLFATMPAGAQPASNAGQDELDRATELHLAAQSLRDLEEVIALCERALRKGLDADNQKLAHQLAASCLYQRGSTIAAAIVNTERATPRWPQLREIALNDLERAVEHSPELTEAYELICKLALLPDGDREQGLKAASKLIELRATENEELAEAYLLRARFRDDPEQRLADLDAAAQADPENVEIWKARASLLYENGEFEKAADAFRKLVEQSPEDPMLHLALAETLAKEEGKHEEAIEHIEKAIELEPQSTRGHLLRAQLEAARDNLDAAFESLDAALKIDPADITALLLRSEMRLYKGDYTAAREDVEKAMNARPGLVVGYLLRSRISAAEKKFDEAIRDMKTLIQSDPNNSDYQLQLAYYYNADERPRKAIELLTEIIENNAENWRALRARGDALLSIGKHAEAIADYEAALQIQPEDSGLLNNLAWVLATSPEDGLRDGQRSIELATKACELTDYKEAHILSTLASGYAETEQWEKAVEYSRKAVELGEGEMKEQLQKELESYLMKKPWREKQDVKEKPEIDRRNLLET